MQTRAGRPDGAAKAQAGAGIPVPVFVQRLDVRICSPQGMGEHRRAAAEAMRRWNVRHIDERGVALIAAMASEVPPHEVTASSQAASGRNGPRSPLLVALLSWTSFGNAAASTVEEIDRAIDGDGEVLVYLCTKPVGAKQKQKRSTEKYLAKIGSSVCIGRYAGLSALRTQMDAHLTGAVDKLRESGWVYCDPPASAHDAGANLAATPTPGGAPFPFPQRRPPDSATADRQMTRLSDTLVEQVDGWHNERKRAWDPGSVAALLGRTATAARQAVGAGLPDDACVTCVFLSHVFNGIIPNCQKLVAPTGAARAQLTRQIDVAFTLVRRAADALAQPAGVAVGEIDLGRLLGEGAEPGAPQQAAGDDMARVGPARRPRSGPEEAKRAHSLPDVALVHRGLLDHREDNTYTLSATARELLGAVTIPAEGP